MNYFKTSLFILFSIVLFTSCREKEEDEGKLPGIAFKTGGDYISQNVSLSPGDTAHFGVNCYKTEDKDYLTRFDVSLSKDKEPFSSVFNKVLSGSEQSNYSFDSYLKMDTVAGLRQYRFTVTNRDGLINQLQVIVELK